MATRRPGFTDEPAPCSGPQHRTAPEQRPGQRLLPHLQQLPVQPAHQVVRSLCGTYIYSGVQRADATAGKQHNIACVRCVRFRTAEQARWAHRTYMTDMVQGDDMMTCDGEWPRPSSCPPVLPGPCRRQPNMMLESQTASPRAPRPPAPAPTLSSDPEAGTGPLARALCPGPVELGLAGLQRHTPGRRAGDSRGRQPGNYCGAAAAPPKSNAAGCCCPCNALQESARQLMSMQRSAAGLLLLSCYSRPAAERWSHECSRPPATCCCGCRG